MLDAATSSRPARWGPRSAPRIEFVEATGKEVLITDAEHLKEALARQAGTFIVPRGEVETAPLA